MVSDASEQVVAFLDVPLIDPDTGRIHGFFVLPTMAGVSNVLFLQCMDILAWGTKVHVKSEDRLAPPEDLIRLASAFGDARPFLGQYIKSTDSRKTLGVCADIQFNTRHFVVEWLFPRKLFFFSGEPLPMADIVEVTKEAIWVRDPLKVLRQRDKERMEEAAIPSVLPDAVPSVLQGRDTIRGTR